MQKNTCRGGYKGLGGRVKNAIAFLAIAASLSACTTIDHKPLPEEISTHLTGKKVVLTKYTTPGFVPIKAGSVLFGAIGMAVTIAQGHAFVEQYQLEDPAMLIGQELSEKLKAERGVSLISDQNIIVDDDDVHKLASSYTGADYLLDIKTLGWAYIYYPTNWTHYKVLYNARMRMIDSSTQKIIAEAGCNSTEGDDNNPPSSDELLDNNASLLKAYLAKAASGCANVFAKDILKLSFKPIIAGTGASSSVRQATSIIMAPALSSQPTQSVQPSAQKPAPAGITDGWSGLMACEARKDIARPPYQAKFAMDVSDTSVVVHRETPKVVETLSGRVTNGMLDLRGTGHLTDSPAKGWTFRFNGEFPAGATIFSGKGNMLLQGRAIRTCELTMVHS